MICGNFVRTIFVLEIFLQQYFRSHHITVNCEYFVSKIFHAIDFRVKIIFGQTTLYRIIVNIAHIFRAFNFAQARLSENILTSKYYL